MARNRAPNPYWEAGTEYHVKEPKQHLVQPRTVGPMAPRRTVDKSHMPEPPRPVPPAPKKPIPTPAPRRGAVRTPRTIGTVEPRKAYKSDRPMPKTEEHALRQEARAQWPDDQDKQDAYVYGTMRKHGWKPDQHSPWDGKSYKHWYFGKMKV
jgi:hypothetical protein